MSVGTSLSTDIFTLTELGTTGTLEQILTAGAPSEVYINIIRRVPLVYSCKMAAALSAEEEQVKLFIWSVFLWYFCILRLLITFMVTLISIV